MVLSIHCCEYCTGLLVWLFEVCLGLVGDYWHQKHRGWLSLIHHELPVSSTVFGALQALHKHILKEGMGPSPMSQVVGVPSS